MIASKLILMRLFSRKLTKGCWCNGLKLQGGGYGVVAEKITLLASAALLEMMAAWRVVAFVHELGLNNAIF